MILQLIGGVCPVKLASPLGSQIVDDGFGISDQLLAKKIVLSLGAQFSSRSNAA